VVDTMHDRKHRMLQLSHGCIAMPGGFGTLEEIFEVLTWVQLNVLDKPCVFVSVDAYYDDLFKFLDNTAAMGLLPASSPALAHQVPTAKAALEVIQSSWAADEAAP